MHPYLDGLKAPLHIAHRGGARLFPENTMYAFSRARETYRTDMLELDVRVTRDGEVVVVHDATLERCTEASGAVAEWSWDELRKVDAAYHFTPEGVEGTPLRGRGVHIPRFVEVLDSFPGLRINVEVKSEDAVEPFVALVRRRPGELDRLCIGSELDSIAATLATALPGACLFYPANALAAFVMSARGGEEVEDDPRFLVLDMPLEWEGMTVFDASVARACAARGKWVNIWTVDDAEQMRTAIAEGVGGIMTDRPDVLRDVIDAVA